MRVIFPRLSGFCSKILEVIGAGLASTIGAFLLSQIVSKPEPVVPPEPRMVQIVPADAETMRRVRTDEAALIAEIKKATEAQAPAETAVVPTPAPKAAAAATPKPVKSTQAVPLPREPKLEAARPTPTAPRTATVEPLPVIPATAAATLPARPAAQPAVQEAEQHAAPPAEAAEGGGFRILSTLRQVPSWFLPDTDRLFGGDAPRPPMPVGQFLSSTM